MSREIDCLIVGTGVGGLACGTILAQRGWRVLLLTRRPLQDSFFWVQDGFEHDRSPELLWGFEAGGPLHPLLASKVSERSLVQLKPGIQVVLPNHRVGFYPSGPDWERELRREFPGCWQSMLACSEELCRLSEMIWKEIEAPLRSITSWRHTRLIGRRPLRSFLREREAPLPFCHMAEAVAGASFQVDPRQTTVAMAAAAFGHTHRGFFAPREGMRGVAEGLISRLQALGGEIRVGAVGEVKSRWGEVRGVTMTDGEVVSCRYVVLEAEVSSEAPILHALVEEALIPGEMGRNVLVVGADSVGAGPSAVFQLALGGIPRGHDPLLHTRTVAVRILHGSPENPIDLLGRAFPGWTKAKVCSLPPRPHRVGRSLLSNRWPRPRNMLLISRESPVGCGLSAAAWQGCRVATRLIGRRSTM